MRSLLLFNTIALLIMMIMSHAEISACDSTTLTKSASMSDETQLPGYFTVWARDADHVYVRGVFNNWQLSDEMYPTDNAGHWACYVPEAQFGDAYKFYIVKGAETAWRIDPRNPYFSQSGDSIIYNQHAYSWRDTGFRSPAKESLVIYEMHIDGISRDENSAGNFSKAIDKLDYLQELGINAVELMPVWEFPTSTSWGYNPQYPFFIERDFGAPDDFKRFVDECHIRGISVLMDVVFNHWDGNSDLWCYDLDSNNSYFYSDTCDWLAKNHNGNSLDPKTECNWWMTPWGPRPNYLYNPAEPRQYIYDSMYMWVKYFHIDGFRWDSTLMIRNTDNSYGASPECDNWEGWLLMQWINDALHEWKPECLSIAEDLHQYDRITQPTGSNGAGFDTQWHPFYSVIRGIIYPQNDYERSMTWLAESILQRYNGDVFQRVIFSESHDEVGCLNGKHRIVQDLANIWSFGIDSWIVKKLSTLAAGIVLTMPGIPMLFMGQEFFDAGCWTEAQPLAWNNLESFEGMVELYRDLIHLRTNETGKTPGLRGDYVHVYEPYDEFNKIIIFHRKDAFDNDVVVVANFSNQIFPVNGPVEYHIGFPKPGAWYVHFNSDSTEYDPNYENAGVTSIQTIPEPAHGYPQSARIYFGRYSLLIFSQIPFNPVTPTPRPTLVPATPFPTPTPLPSINAWHYPNSYEACIWETPMRHNLEPSNMLAPICIYVGVDPIGAIYAATLHYRVNNGLWKLHHFWWRCADPPYDYWWTNCNEPDRNWVPYGSYGDTVEYYIELFQFGFSTTYVYNEEAPGATIYEEEAIAHPFWFTYPACDSVESHWRRER